MEYDVANVGGEGFDDGACIFLEVSQRSKFQFISANLVDKKTGNGIFKPYVIKEIAGLKIGITGLLDEQFTTILQEKDPELTILEPISTSKAITKSLRENCELIVVLSQLGESKDKKLGKENPQIDLT